jgi:hypothetical protein
LSPTLKTLRDIGETAGYFGNKRYFMVKNFINNTTLGSKRLGRL